MARLLEAQEYNGTVVSDLTEVKGGRLTPANTQMFGGKLAEVALERGYLGNMENLKDRLITLGQAIDDAVMTMLGEYGITSFIIKAEAKHVGPDVEIQLPHVNGESAVVKINYFRLEQLIGEMAEGNNPDELQSQFIAELQSTFDAKPLTY